jgi:hypothetical protein
MGSPWLQACYLNATGLEPLPEDLLEEGDVVEVHQGIVLARDVGKGSAIFAAFHVTTAEALPRLELLVHPVRFRSLEGNGIEHVQDLCDGSSVT